MVFVVVGLNIPRKGIAIVGVAVVLPPQGDSMTVASANLGFTSLAKESPCSRLPSNER